MRADERGRLQEAFHKLYGDRYTRPGLEERVVSHSVERWLHIGQRPRWGATLVAIGLGLVVVLTLLLLTVGPRMPRPLGLTVPAGTPSPAAQSTSPPQISPTPAQAAQAPSPRAPCRVPFYEDSGQGGFTAKWATPSGPTTLDSSGTLTKSADGLYQSTAGPVLKGTWPGYYDVAKQRWLPAPRAAVSPDGSRYAYKSAVGRSDSVRIVEVATGQERTLPVPANFWHVLDFAADGIYLNQAYEGTGPGLWRLDPQSGRLTQVLGSEFVVNAVQRGSAWVEDVDPAAPARPNAFAGGYSPNRLSRLDIQTRTLTHWLTTPDASPLVIGYDASGNPVVAAFGQSETEIWVTTGPGQARRITTYPNGAVNWQEGGSAIGDDGGIWFGAADGIYFYGPNGYARVVATSHQPLIANRCV